MLQDDHVKIRRIYDNSQWLTNFKDADMLQDDFEDEITVRYKGEMLKLNKLGFATEMDLFECIENWKASIDETEDIFDDEWYE